jgi:hypothetical protein
MVQRPLTVEQLGGAIYFQRIMDGAVRAASGNNSAEGWLTVSLLQHVSGQHELASGSLKKAGEQGLDKNVLDAFTLEFSKSLPQQATSTQPATVPQPSAQATPSR